MIVEKQMECRLAGETEFLGENLPQRHFVHHKSQWLDPVLNPGRRDGKPATNCLSYGAASNANLIRMKFNSNFHTPQQEILEKYV
jgi:hypothetical protein